MEASVKNMIEEHAQLVIRTRILHNYVYSGKSDKENKADFANKCIQLRAMKVYEEALRARLLNQGIEITDEGEYYEKVANIQVVVPSSEETPDNKENEDGSKS